MFLKHRTPNLESVNLQDRESTPVVVVSSIQARRLRVREVRQCPGHSDHLSELLTKTPSTPSHTILCSLSSPSQNVPPSRTPGITPPSASHRPFVSSSPLLRKHSKKWCSWSDMGVTSCGLVVLQLPLPHHGPPRPVPCGV